MWFVKMVAMAVGVDEARAYYWRVPNSFMQSGHCQLTTLLFSKIPSKREWKAPGSHVSGKRISLAMRFVQQWGHCLQCRMAGYGIRVISVE